jgi:hypothetical protein
MPAHLLEPTDVIPVDFVPVMIFGPPGCGKTSIAQTADEPITLDFDKGIHRSFNRKKAVRFDRWEDVTDAMDRGLFDSYQPIVVDTVGRLLDTMVPMVADQSAKHRGPGGMGLSPTGYGVLGNWFAGWIKRVRDMGKDLVMLAHEDVGKDAADNPSVTPDMPGKMSWKEIHKWTDLIGYVRYEERRKFIDFNPNQVVSCCKNPAQWEPIRVPRLEDKPRFLAELLADAKAKMGQVGDQAANAARVLADWQGWLKGDPNLAAFNARLPEVGTLTNGLKRQVWELVSRHAKDAGLTFDPQSKTFH